MATTKKLTDEYFEYYKTYTKEYGEKTCIMMQIGSFYEMQMIKNETENIGNLTEIADILNIQITRKNKSITTVDRNNPNFAGFPKHSLSKFITILLENGYTVVLIDQDETKSSNKTVRKVAGIYSPSIQPLGLTNDKSDEDNNLMSILIEYEMNKYVTYSICNMNMSTNALDIYDKGITVTNKNNQLFENVLDDIYRIILRYNSKELIINIVSNDKDNEIFPKQLTKSNIIEYLDVWNKRVQIEYNNNNNKQDVLKTYRQISYQNEYLKKVYKHIDFGILSPIEFFDLEQYQLSIVNCIYLINYISKHDDKYIENIAIPNVVKEYDNLILEMNTLHQLNILSNKKINGTNGSLFDILNKTCTSIGKRGLKKLLCKPLKKTSDILLRYELTDILEKTNEKSTKSSRLQHILSEIADFERLHRRLSLQVLHPYEFSNLHTSYQKIIELMEYIQMLKDTLDDNSKAILEQILITQDVRTQLDNYIKEYSNLFELEELRKYNLNDIDNIFKQNNLKDIDKIQNEINDIKARVEQIRQNYERLITNESNWIKCVYSDQDGYYFTCSKIRTQLLEKELDKQKSEHKLIVKTNTSVCKITTDELKKISLKLVNLEQMMKKKIKIHYINSLQHFSDTYNSIFTKLKDFVEIVDLIHTNIKCKNLYNYCKPEIVDCNESFIDAVNLRHPIIERINENTVYVPNDIKLLPEKRGMVLYALNSCGKSSLLRSVGLAIVMAQCGLYVPCSEFRYYPFDTIITQVDLYDNLWKAQSSFITEMIGLRKILKIANKNCLVLSDELTKGTEVISATSIFATSVLHLLQKQSCFIFTTHLIDVAKIESIKTNSNLQICHLSVDVKDDSIIFERKLMPGPCSELYGLEVAKAIGLDVSFIDDAFKTRDTLINRKSEILATKKSRYNKIKLLDSCEICNYCPKKSTDIPLDTHHIKFQCTADEKNFTGHYHKNAKFNLVCLCKKCHIAVHENKIIINGYIQTTKGIVLDYIFNKK